MTRIIDKADALDPAACLAAGRALREEGKTLFAHTMLRCARSLGAAVPEADLDAMRVPEDRLLLLGSVYQRNMRVVDLLRAHFGSSGFSLVDVGGGNGILSQMIPEADYLLCEPRVNGLYTDDLVAAGRQFDVCVATHVFEHIPDPEKPAFFETLVKLSRKGIVLCNPTETGDAVERQKFLLDVYGPLNWIVEHLEAGTPEIPVFEDLAEANGLDLHIYPNGNVFIGMAQFAMRHFAKAANDPAVMEQCDKLMAYINERRHLQNSEETPRDYAFVFVKPDGG